MTFPDVIVASGLDAVGGGYSGREWKANELAAAILAQKRPPSPRRVMSFAAFGGEDEPTVPWGIITTMDMFEAVEALAPLTEHRGKQDRVSQLYFSPKEDAAAFMTRPSLPRHTEGKRYFLIVGGPEKIPFSFQQELQAACAVGRLCFDEASDYRRYAENVVRLEEQPSSSAGTTAFFATTHDALTKRTADNLVKPLANRIKAGWQRFDHEASREALSTLLTGASPPSLLFAAAHGLSFPGDEPRRRLEQGAIVCQDLASPTWRFPITATAIFSGMDVGPSVQLDGMIAMLYSAFSAGASGSSQFSEKELSPFDVPFVAEMPQRMLRQGALAVVGLLDRSWGFSVDGGSQSRALATAFERAVFSISRGARVGSALHGMQEWRLTLATQLEQIVSDNLVATRFDANEVVSLWSAWEDTRNLILLGDPAVRLPSI